MGERLSRIWGGRSIEVVSDAFEPEGAWAETDAGMVESVPAELATRHLHASGQLAAILMNRHFDSRGRRIVNPIPIDEDAALNSALADLRVTANEMADTLGVTEKVSPLQLIGVAPPAETIVE